MRIIKSNIHDHDASFYEEAFHDLSACRIEKALRYQAEEDKYSCILGDHLIRKAVAEETGCNPHLVCIAHTASGMPYIALPHDCGLHVSLSHSGGVVVIAINSVPVGIDVECIRAIDDSVIRHVLSHDEKEYVGSSCHRFFEVWTKKEAYLKCIGTGLSGYKSLRDVSVFNLPRGYVVKVVEATETYIVSVCEGMKESTY